MEQVNQQQIVTIDRGLFLVRYAAAEDQARPPRVKLSADPGSNGNISFVLFPDHHEPVLWQPETCLVVRALAASKLAVQVLPMEKGGSTAAVVRIEPLNQGKAAPSLRRDQPALDLGSFRVLGHLTRRGDVIVNSDEWLAGPTMPARIEGISIDWPGKPADLEIRYAVKTAKSQSISGRIVQLGGFAGTRGKAMPLVGLTVEMGGAAASDFQMSAEAIFLGAPAMRVQGKRIVLSGPTGREPLVGLRLGIGTVRRIEPLARKRASVKSERASRRSDRARNRVKPKRQVAARR